jgi:hypothetical protein
VLFLRLRFADRRVVLQQVFFKEKFMRDTQSYADSFKFMLLAPGIRLLEDTPINFEVVDVIFHNLFRQMEMWRYDFSSLPRHGLVYDPGVSKEEAREVYRILDRVFSEVFPSQAGLGREISALWLEDLIHRARTEVFHFKSNREPSVRQLWVFMKRLFEALSLAKA